MHRQGRGTGRGEGIIQLKTKIRLAMAAAESRKAADVVALDLKGLASFTDSFIICDGNQRRQTQAISDAVVERLAGEGIRPAHVEGYARGDWILLDYADLVVHVFTRETRAFYGLERLWGDARRIAPSGPQRRTGRRSPAARPG